jgi:MFS family permease
MTRTLYEYSKRHKELSTNATFSNLSLFSMSDPIMQYDVEAFNDGDVQQLQAHQVSAISIGNALGRILIGVLSDLLVNRTGNPAYRVYMLLLVCALALVSQGLAATPNVVTDLKKLLGISSVTGLMYGTL